MRHILLTLILLLSGCSAGLPTLPSPSPAPSPTAAPTATATASPEPTAEANVGQFAQVITPVVRVHVEPDVASEVVHWLTTGEAVSVLEIAGDWARVEQGWVWRGCLSGNDDLGCEAE